MQRPCVGLEEDGGLERTVLNHLLRAPCPKELTDLFSPILVTQKADLLSHKEHACSLQKWKTVLLQNCRVDPKRVSRDPVTHYKKGQHTFHTVLYEVYKALSGFIRLVQTSKINQKQATGTPNLGTQANA